MGLNGLSTLVGDLWVYYDWIGWVRVHMVVIHGCVVNYYDGIIWSKVVIFQ